MASWGARVQAMRRQPAGARFAELVALLARLGYAFDRQRGSHQIYHADGLPPVNIQAGKGGKAKPYQVRQVLAIIDEFSLEVE